jgi:hypothetical protein
MTFHNIKDCNVIASATAAAILYLPSLFSFLPLGWISEISNVLVLFYPSHKTNGCLKNSMTNTISGQKTGGQELVGGLDCTVHRNFFGSQVMHVFDVASFVG